ncbi:hypothetical protein JKA74_00275 [Marivirga sp. S37H4]|uniref:Outer membrane protein beta-barrel domain-containing protein n=1 Tax=Marivirga aurantiaca TaxID=2802615 RepID=A0A934WV00_9BACT|nr:hypothetical protein [Marivirga aurantiaca]MBK6263451.1 hypothetical protein [Marivirga aurantiaca]
MKKLLVILCFLLSCPVLIFAQIENPKLEERPSENLRSMVTVYLKTGEIYKGYFISQNKEFLEIESETLGRITIQTARIKKIDAGKSNKPIVVDAEKNQLEDLNAMRYFFGTSGFNFKKGESYIRNNPMTYHKGITDNFSIGVGTSFFFGILGVPILFVNPHYTKSINKNLHFKAGLGAAIGVSIGDAEGGAGALLNTGLTLGNPDINLTGTFYYGVVSDFGSSSFVSLAGKARIGRKLAIISENAFFYNEFNGNSGNIMLSYGLRYITESGSFDLGFINNRDFGEFYYIGIPFIALTLGL